LILLSLLAIVVQFVFFQFQAGGPFKAVYGCSSGKDWRKTLRNHA
jgi:hypothetical protein